MVSGGAYAAQFLNKIAGWQLVQDVVDCSPLLEAPAQHRMVLYSPLPARWRGLPESLPAAHCVYSVSESSVFGSSSSNSGGDGGKALPLYTFAGRDVPGQAQAAALAGNYGRGQLIYLGKSWDEVGAASSPSGDAVWAHALAAVVGTAPGLSQSPSSAPTPHPTHGPTGAPTSLPTPAPTARPTLRPTSTPTAEPTPAPSARPTHAPTPSPTPDYDSVLYADPRYAGPEDSDLARTVRQQTGYRHVHASESWEDFCARLEFTSLALVPSLHLGEPASGSTPGSLQQVGIR